MELLRACLILLARRRDGVPKKPIMRETPYGKPPKALSEHLFYGLVLDSAQEVFRDAIWSEDVDIVFADARAGTGKTLIAAATANMLCEYGRYKGIVYIMSPCQEQTLGFLPGSQGDKESPYMEGFYQALMTIGVNMGMALNDDISNQKQGTGYIETRTHTFLRGLNFENKVVILDESQNMTVPEMQKIITRIHDNCKVVVIGHHLQIDIKNPSKSGFVRYLEHFKDKPRATVCELTKNYRGWIASHADSIND